MLKLKKVKKLLRESGSLRFFILNIRSYLLTYVDNRFWKITGNENNESTGLSKSLNGHVRLPDGNNILYDWKDRHETNYIIKEIYHLGVYHRMGCPLEGQVVMDVGGHIGIYTLNAARKVGSRGKVVTVEPAPGNYKILTKNVRNNHLDNVTLINSALSSSPGKGKLFLKGSGRNSLVSTGNGDFVETELTTLDKLVDRLGLTHIDTLKIDVESAEVEVLKGALNSLRSKIKSLVIAAYHYPTEVDEITELLNLVAPHLKIKVIPSQESDENDLFLYAY